MERLERLEKLVKELYPECQWAKSDLELLKDITSDLVMSALEDRQNLKELHAALDRPEKMMEEDRRRAEKDREWMRKKWGEMAQRLGTLTEDIFAPGIPYLVKRLGYKIKKRMLDVEYKKDGRCNQYDAIVVAEDKAGKEVVFVAEVKSQLRAGHFEEFRKKLKNLPFYEPEYAGKIVPVLAAFKIPESLIAPANRRGVLLVRMGGEYLEPLNPEVLK
ncbi:hypothetical protein FVE67_07155 [Thermosulfurimonas marina]|uniref:DUF3782 domain-containing protein n=1 Tax=Thermosulfurimonas marina TaxID=2047767 RepID=A0A6H1WTN6_9BACT|nr:hypothetical protein [Thermosulfurimonas marina]QJA06585.1 hypothetical protein FVE67_07155 [Thermosulfurimonas marina]